MKRKNIDDEFEIELSNIHEENKKQLNDIVHSNRVSLYN